MIKPGDTVETNFPIPNPNGKKDGRKVRAKYVPLRGTVVGVGLPVVAIAPDVDVDIPYEIVMRHIGDVSLAANRA